MEGGIRERKGSKREPKGSGTFKAQHEQRRGRASAISIAASAAAVVRRVVRAAKRSRCARGVRQR